MGRETYEERSDLAIFFSFLRTDRINEAEYIGTGITDDGSEPSRFE